MAMNVTQGHAAGDAAEAPSRVPALLPRVLAHHGLKSIYGTHCLLTVLVMYCSEPG